MRIKTAEKELSDETMDQRGLMLVEVLKLKRDGPAGPSPRFRTTWGSKTYRGLYLTVKRIIERGE